jgi:hypothetical protein
MLKLEEKVLVPNGRLYHILTLCIFYCYDGDQCRVKTMDNKGTSVV